MSVAAKLEGGVGEVCIPPCFPSSTSGNAATPTSTTGGDGSVEAAAAAAASGATRRLVRAVRLLGIVGQWSELLDSTALRELGTTLLRLHILPHLAKHLRQPVPALRHVLIACERAAQPARRRPGDGGSRGDGGGCTDCASLLHGFVAAQLLLAVRSAPAGAGGAPTANAEQRCAKLLALFE